MLVNNAGGLGGRSGFEEMTTEFYRSVLALNLDSVFFDLHFSLMKCTPSSVWSSDSLPRLLKKKKKEMRMRR